VVSYTLSKYFIEKVFKFEKVFKLQDKISLKESFYPVIQPLGLTLRLNA